METDKQIKTSVAMCTYNGSRFLEEQLDSIVGQTCPPDEIVICDDGSSDDTLDIAETCLRDWQGTVHIEQNQKNLGFVKNFEKAIGLCHGDIIFLSDQDDVWHREKIEVMMHAFEEHPEAAMVFHDAALVDQHLKPLFPSFWENTLGFDYKPFLEHDYKRLYASNVVQGSACAFKKQVYEKAAPFYGDFHDEWLALVSLTIGEIVPIPKSLMKYRQASNALGGMPVSSTAKTKEVMKNTKERYLSDIKKYHRQLELMNTLMERYQIEEKSYPLDIKGYTHFLRKRIEFLEHRQLSQIFAFNQYRRYLFDYKKSYFKDIFEIVFRK
jgi:glycosyltransferase involved in cell wall biosynthesis